MDTENTPLQLPLDRKDLSLVRGEESGVIRTKYLPDKLLLIFALVTFSSASVASYTPDSDQVVESQISRVTQIMYAHAKGDRRYRNGYYEFSPRYGWVWVPRKHRSHHYYDFGSRPHRHGHPGHRHDRPHRGREYRQHEEPRQHRWHSRERVSS